MAYTTIEQWAANHSTAELESLAGHAAAASYSGSPSDQKVFEVILAELERRGRYVPHASNAKGD